MKNTIEKISRSGFTIIELIAVMVIITIILGSVLAAVQGATNTSRVTSTLASIKALQTASINYYNANGGSYASSGSLGAALSLASLAAQNMLPAGIGSGVNAWGGSITVQPDTNPLYFDIVLSNVPSTAQTPLQNTVSNIAEAVPTYSAKTQTWTGIF